MLTSEELFPPEYCFVGRCSSHLAPFLPPPSHHRHSLLPLPSSSRRHCFNETGKCNLFVLPSPLPSQKGLPTVLSPLFAIPFSALPSSPARRCLSVFLFHSRRESLAAIFESFLRRPSRPAEIPPTRRVAYIDNNGIYAEETRAGLVTPPVGCTLFETSEKKVKRIPIIQLNPFVVCGSMPLLSPRYS